MSGRNRNNVSIERKAPPTASQSDAYRRAGGPCLGIGIVCAVALVAGSAEAASKPPRLTLFIAVDALSSELLLRSRPHLKGGLARLISEGAYYPTARYDYAKTVTAPGHATLATGANPWHHGIVTNQVVNRANGKLIPIFADPEHPVLEAPQSADDVSPRNLIAETVSDRLRLATQGRGKSIAVAGKARAAIAMAGRLGKAWWFSESVGKFVTGTFYAKEFPRWVKTFNDRQLPQSHFGKQWTLTLPPQAYLGDDERPYESDWNTLGRAFPHPLSAGLSSPGPQYYRVLETTPYLNDILVELAKAAIQGEELGKDEVPDLLSISFSPIDFIYHSFGPYSWEMQDAMIRLDKSVGDLLVAAEKAAGGKSNLLVVLSADHGGAAIPEEWAAAGMPGTRVNPIPLQQGLAKELHTRFAADLVAGVQSVDVYLNDKAAKDKNLDGGAVRRAAAAWLASQPDVTVAIARDDLFNGSDRFGWLDMLRRSYYPERSGDVLFLMRPFAVLYDAKDGTEHGSPYAYDAEVPVIFSGKGVRRGIYRQRISPTDVAPSIASLLEIGTPAMAEGVVRSEAFSSSD
jgi:predicted AlkP superfamily pyrophosphatase or phosphodiesterase